MPFAIIVSAAAAASCYSLRLPFGPLLCCEIYYASSSTTTTTTTTTSNFPQQVLIRGCVMDDAMTKAECDVLMHLLHRQCVLRTPSFTSALMLELALLLQIQRRFRVRSSAAVHASQRTGALPPATAARPSFARLPRNVVTRPSYLSV